MHAPRHLEDKMIDFKVEINKYKPVRTVDEVEGAVRDEIVDIMDLLQHISNKPEPTAPAIAEPEKSE